MAPAKKSGGMAATPKRLALRTNNIPNAKAARGVAPFG
jgi:hypothetical protein